MRSRAINIKEAEPLLSKPVQNELAVFFAHYPLMDLNRNLRHGVVDHFTIPPEQAMYDVCTTMGALSKFMNIPEKAADECKPRSFSETFALAKEARYNSTEEENG